METNSTELDSLSTSLSSPKLRPTPTPPELRLCVCVCVCVRERERERGAHGVWLCEIQVCRFYTREDKEQEKKERKKKHSWAQAVRQSTEHLHLPLLMSPLSASANQRAWEGRGVGFCALCLSVGVNSITSNCMFLNTICTLSGESRWNCMVWKILSVLAVLIDAASVSYNRTNGDRQHCRVPRQHNGRYSCGPGCYMKGENVIQCSVHGRLPRPFENVFSLL